MMEKATARHPQIYEKLKTVFQQVFDTPTLEICEETTAADIEEWDSLMHINLIVAAEQAFEVKFTTKEIQSLENVGNFICLIASKGR